MIGRLIPPLAALALVVAGAVPAARAIQADANGRVRRARRSRAPATTCSRASSPPSSTRRSSSPVRFQVVNKPGGGSTTAATYMVSKKNDPHVIACFTNIWLIDPLVQQAATNRSARHEPDRAAGGRAGAGGGARGFAATRRIGHFIEAAKANPAQLRWSGGSITSRENMVRQLLMKVTGARWQFISFPSGGERLAALLGGHVEMMIVDPSEAGEQIRAGKFRAIAQVSRTPPAGLPRHSDHQGGGLRHPGRAADARRRRRARHAGRRGRLLRRPVLQGEPDAGVEEVRRPKAELDGEFVRAKELKPFLRASRAAARHSEGSRRQGGAVTLSRPGAHSCEPVPGS